MIGGENEKTHPSILSALHVTPADADLFEASRDLRSYRNELQILVVEDQVFSQRLLCDILRGTPACNKKTTFIDTARGILEAWQLYLLKAPDIAFIDLGLIDGSGHTLTRAIKELDPESCVIIVTADPCQKEVDIARENNVDGFIAKPYRKKQITDYVDRHIAALRGHGRSAKQAGVTKR